MKGSNLPLTQLMGLIRMLPPELKQTLAQLLTQEQDQAAAQPGEEEGLGLWEEDDDEDWDDEDWDDEDWDEDEEGEEDEGLDRRKLLAAEIFCYSYDHYEDHLGDPRFDELMPRDVDILEQAEREGWDDARLASALESATEKMPELRHSTRRAVEIVDAPTPVESFRRGVRFSIEDAVEEGLGDQEAIGRLVGQICYRAADLGYLLDVAGEPLWVYSEQLRQEDDLSSDSPLPGEQTGG
jgi:hypothetical protein